MNQKIPINDCYYKLLECKKRYLVLVGSAGSGKSTFASDNVIKRVLTEKNHNFLVVRKVKDTVRLSVFEELKKSIERLHAEQNFSINKSTYSFECNNTGSKITTAGLDDVNKLKSISRVTSIWAEEATELSYNDFMQLDIRMRGDHNKSFFQFILTFNPDDEDHWLNSRFFAKRQLTESDKAVYEDAVDDDTVILKTTYKDNTFLTEEDHKIYEKLRDQDENFYRIYALGLWGGKIRGLIYPDWKVVDRVPNGIPFCWGLDFGYNDPTSLNKVSFADPELYIDEHIYKTHLTTKQLIQEMKDVGVGEYDDIYADSARPDTIQELYDNGFYGIKKANKDIILGINRVKAYRLHVTKQSENTIGELKKYKWKEDRGGQALDVPVDAFNHSMDSTRYALTHRIDTYDGCGIDVL